MSRLVELLREHPVVILDGAKRTPRADILIQNKAPGLFAEFTTNTLGAHAIRATLEASGVQGEQIGHVTMANAMDSHRDSIYGARSMALQAGLPEDVPALTLARICGSGSEAAADGVRRLLLGDHPPERPFQVVGGAESMQYPHAVYGLRGRDVGGQVVKYGPLDCAQLKGNYLQDTLHMSLYDPNAQMAMANTAEHVGRKYGITRRQADEFALRSHHRAERARDGGWFDEEIAPVVVPQDGGTASVCVRHDTHIRDGLTMADLSRLRPVFEPPHGIITAGNASGVVDGAAAMVIAFEATAREHGLRPLARIVSYGVAALDPTVMGLGPVPSTRRALERAGLDGSDIDCVELNEAFAPQALACMKDFADMGIDPEKVNPVGGAIAQGHPLGATGAVLTLTCAYHLRRHGLRFGLVTMCIGGGQGIATILENPEA